MHPFPGILAIAILTAGWYYVFYTHAADRLHGVEGPLVNGRRTRNRRIAGVLMMVMAVLFYLGSYTFHAELQPDVFLGLWLGVLALLAGVLGLAVYDLRLTAKLRRKERP